MTPLELMMNDLIEQVVRGMSVALARLISEAQGDDTETSLLASQALLDFGWGFLSDLSESKEEEVEDDPRVER